MRVGIRRQTKAVQAREAPIHRRVRREPGLDRKYVRRKIAITFLDRIEAGLRAERSEPRRPDMGGNEVRMRARLQRDLQKMARVEPKDRPPIRSDIADAGEAGGEPVDAGEIRRVD